jgi:hypothetical protein
MAPTRAQGVELSIGGMTCASCADCSARPDGRALRRWTPVHVRSSRAMAREASMTCSPRLEEYVDAVLIPCTRRRRPRIWPSLRRSRLRTASLSPW